MPTIFYADCVGNSKNILYPHQVSEFNEDALKEAFSHDYVCAEYKGNRRGNVYFKSSDTLVFDLDNEFSDNPGDWITPEKVKEAFPDVTFAVHYSRNHMKAKSSKSARPRFHVLFPVDLQNTAEEYAALKKMAAAHFPYFDSNAMDAARFMFGTPEPKVEILRGSRMLSDFLREKHIAELDSDDIAVEGLIPEGERNSRLSKSAARFLKRYGDTGIDSATGLSKARRLFDSQARRCEPPLSDAELTTIWNSAMKLYERIRRTPGYIPPEDYDRTLRPEEFTDVDEAQVLAEEYSERLKYSPGTDWIVYNGRVWDESVELAEKTVHEFTSRQMREASILMLDLWDEMEGTDLRLLLPQEGRKRQRNS